RTCGLDRLWAAGFRARAPGLPGRGRRRVQALHVARQRLDLLVSEVLGDVGHHAVGVRAAAQHQAVAERLELARRVLRELPAHGRVRRTRVAAAGRAVAGQAGRDVPLGVAAAVELLARLVE